MTENKFNLGGNIIMINDGEFKTIGIIPDFNLGIIRNNLHFCRTAGVPEEEYKALMKGVERIIKETGRNLIIQDLDNFKINGNEYSSPDWYQTQALTKRDNSFGIQVNAEVIDKLLREEPLQKQKPHFDVIIVDKDLTYSDCNFIFGYGLYPNNIISVKRFLSIKDISLRKICLEVISAHEFGHLLYLVERNFNIGKEGLKISHCNGEKGPCVMEQFNVCGCRDIEEHAKLLINKERWLCADCTEEINYRKKKFGGKGIPW